MAWSIHMPPEPVLPPEPEARTHILRDRRLLVVEDDYLLATDLAEALRAHGVKVIGPAARVEDALSLVASADGIDGAVLCADLGGEPAYPLADALRQGGVPFAFVTGYDAWAIPKAYADAPYFEKPVDADGLVSSLARALWG
jgi:DNA-binding response OmpR family regulator